ncbi:MAG: helix-turn-helix domain-containing protein [Ardenticatenales bacterium]|nr:helix-turn-helix domain-containing protein [Ardenticatenales bacterium]
MVAPIPLPTVREMGRLALPLGTTLAAGALGLGRPARWARTSGVLSPLFPQLNADEVALLDFALVQASNPNLTLSRVVRELGRVGLSAIVIKGEVDNGARREAERSNLPLFALPEGADLPRTARAIIRLISDREAQEEAQAAALYRRLSQQVMSGAGLQGVVEDLHRLVGHLVEVSAAPGNLLARAGSTLPGSETVTQMLPIGESATATLTLCDIPEALDGFSRMALEQGAAALALELAKMEAVEAAREGVYGDFVATLLLGEEESVLLARARVADYPLEQVQWVVLGVAARDEATEEILRDWMRRAMVRAEAVGWHVRLHLGEIHLPLMAEAWQSTFVLAGGSAGWETGRSDFLSHLATDWSAPTMLSLAAGDPARGAEGLRHSLVQASDALVLGMRLLGEGGCYLHKEMGLYRLLRHLQGTEDLRQFLDSTLSTLEDYDREHATELLTTLQLLLEHGGNISATAKAMHLHRNSMAYRLERIRDIAGLDPTQPNDAFALRLALMLAPLR